MNNRGRNYLLETASRDADFRAEMIFSAAVFFAVILVAVFL